jgi:pimeloyl-ACP methyl ester carboxylesterase
VLLLHGYLSTARETWVRTGIAARLADDGRRVVMPDLRGHGESGRPHDPGAYPPDALVSDAFALISDLDLGDYDLGGYSLGARIAARMLALGAQPARALLGGTGLEPIVHAAGRGERYRRLLGAPGTFAPGSGEAQLEAYLASIGADPVALLLVLDTFVDTPVEALARSDVPTLVFAGDADNDRGSVEDLAAALPRSRLLRVPGDHGTALMANGVGDALAQFLREPAPPYRTGS